MIRPEIQKLINDLENNPTKWKRDVYRSLYRKISDEEVLYMYRTLSIENWKIFALDFNEEEQKRINVLCQKIHDDLIAKEKAVFEENQLTKALKMISKL